ncbi:MAG: hypothetical protein H7293_02025 [Candidatus Saccharibacteria bacterium]|nr:hypothetical protein [Rhodoferax sp.]
MKKIVRASMLLIVVHLSGHARAESSFLAESTRDTGLTWQLSPLTYHFSQNEAHKRVVMVGLEREHPNAQLDGVALFTNSFGQPTVYAYPWGGVYRNLGGIYRLSFKWTAGLLYGYKAPYADKVPLNFKGFSPAVIPAIAYEFKSGWTGQLNFLGTAGLMFQLNVPVV